MKESPNAYGELIAWTLKSNEWQSILSDEPEDIKDSNNPNLRGLPLKSYVEPAMWDNVISVDNYNTYFTESGNWKNGDLASELKMNLFPTSSNCLCM